MLSVLSTLALSAALVSAQSSSVFDVCLIVCCDSVCEAYGTPAVSSQSTRLLGLTTKMKR